MNEKKKHQFFSKFIARHLGNEVFQNEWVSQRQLYRLIAQFCHHDHSLYALLDEMADQDENVLINGTDFEVTTSIDTVNPDSIFKEVFVKNCVDAGRVATGTAMSNKTVQALMEPQSRPDRERHSIMCRTIMLHAFKICKPFRSMQEHEAVWFDGIVDILSKVVFFGELRSAHVQGKTLLRAVLDRLEPIYGIIHEIKHEHCRKIEEHYTRNAISAFIEFYQHANLTWRTWHGMRRTRTGVSIYKDTIDGVKVPVTMASVYYISKGIRAIKPLLPQYEQINCNQTIIMYTERDYSKSLNQLMTHYGEKEFEWETIMLPFRKSCLLSIHKLQ